MEFKELKKKEEKDLHRILAEKRDYLRELRFKDANKQVKNVREIRIIRQTIARILMLLNSKKEKEIVEKKQEKE
ncbi:50S ribosomal protein L29 [Candidatus Parcubacteria bacterium]|nr:50S ribosomal protein L29 [Candidatus Parcubacteria bacterium]